MKMARKGGRYIIEDGAARINPRGPNRNGKPMGERETPNAENSRETNANERARAYQREEQRQIVLSYALARDYLNGMVADTRCQTITKALEFAIWERSKREGVPQ